MRSTQSGWRSPLLAGACSLQPMFCTQPPVPPVAGLPPLPLPAFAPPLDDAPPPRPTLPPPELPRPALLGAPLVPLLIGAPALLPPLALALALALPPVPPFESAQPMPALACEPETP